jgi:peptidoglycan hydrolase-like protein with peptidoglycan-binding domain
MEEVMQRMKQLAMGAFSMALATTGIASADSPRGSQPAPHAGATAPSDMQVNRSSSSNQSSATAASGSNRAQIEQMQRDLTLRGLYHGAIDGMAGPQTMAALRQFQQQQGLPASGQLDDSTRQALGIQLERQPVSGAQTASGPELERPVGREGAAPSITGNQPMRSQVQLDRLNQDQLRTLQTRLQQLGFYQGPVDGVLGEGTRSSLRQFFQTQAELASRGIITDATVSLFGVSPQGLNPPLGNVQQSNTRQSNTPSGASRGTETRDSETHDSMNPPSGTRTPRQGGPTTPPPTNPSQGIR